MTEYDIEVLRQRAGVVEVRRDVVRVAGPDAVGFLQGQLSQDVAALAEGESAWSLLLEPQGKVATFLRVTRTGPDEVVLDTDAGHGDAMVARIERFKLRVKADLEPLHWRCLAVRGPAAAGLADPPPGTWRVVPETPGSGFDLLGPAPEAPAGVEPVSAAAYEVLRIEAGVPRMGAELGPDTIPAAAGVVDRSVSFTKGCYTGQELVARIDSRGGTTPTRLCGVVVEAADEVPPAGAALRTMGDDKDAGTLTSVVAAPDRGPGAAVGLAYVRRAVAVPTEASAAWAGGDVRVRLVSLPIG